MSSWTIVPLGAWKDEAEALTLAMSGKEEEEEEEEASDDEDEDEGEEEEEEEASDDEYMEVEAVCEEDCLGDALAGFFFFLPAIVTTIVCLKETERVEDACSRLTRCASCAVSMKLCSVVQCSVV